jgi:hypothetical protein
MFFTILAVDILAGKMYSLVIAFACLAICGLPKDEARMVKVEAAPISQIERPSVVMPIIDQI